nr:prephenate dehydrogenase [Gemmatimonadota bacterium]
MKEIRQAAVIGLGLIGGSLARELSARGIRVLGYDRDEARVRAALRDGGIHAVLNPELEGIDTADIVVIAVPVAIAPDILQAALPRLGRVRLVVDVGSTKASIMAAAGALGIGSQFVGCHPLAGDHRSGWEASRLGMFQGARVFLCPTTETGEDALGLAWEFWRMLGAHPEVEDAMEHDRRLAWTSHLPQAVSTALALALGGAGIERRELGPGGRDMTRLAGSSPELWTDIALD